MRPFVAALAFAALGLAGCAEMLTSLSLRDRHDAIVAAPDRADADRVNDARRKPARLLRFMDVRPGMLVADLSAGRGYTSELLARSVKPGGLVFAQTPPRATPRTPPAQPEGASAPAAAAPAAGLPTLEDRIRNPALVGVLQRVTRPFEDPVPPEAQGRLDLVTLMFNYHDLGHLGVDRAAMNKAVFRALKPGGTYVIADHSGRPGTGISESGTLHRVEEAFVVREVQAAGFRLAGQGDFLRNSKDPRDRNTPEGGVAKDEFVLKFVKPN